MTKNKYTKTKARGVEAELKILDVRLIDFLAVANIDQSQWSQYANGHRSPSLETWSRAEGALRKLKDEIE